MHGDPRWAGELSRFLDGHGEGVYALALGTPNVDETVREMRKRGLEIVDPADGDGVDANTGAQRRWRNAWVAPRSSNGIRILFIEHNSPPDALPVAPLAGDEPACGRRLDHG